MPIDNLHLLGFSPTGTGRRILQSVAQGYGATGAPYTDMSPRATGSTGYRIDPSGAIVAVAPVHAGRIPEIVVAYIRALGERRRESAAPAVPVLAVVIYGNRAYDDALLEFTDELRAAGFDVVAAAAFVGEHSYSTDDHQVAVGRPDASDREQAVDLGRRFRTLVEELVSNSDPSNGHSSGAEPLTLPGNRPYRERVPLSGESPTTDMDECILCGACESACPLGIVTVTDHVATDSSRCIYCCACVKECPNGSRQITSERVLGFSRWLAENYSERREPEFFLPGE